MADEKELLVKVHYDREGNTLTVWFGNPTDEYVAEETGEEIALMKDRAVSRCSTGCF